MTSSKTPPGYLIWQGPSQFNNLPVNVIITGFHGSNNSKTGNMLQVYYLPYGVDPRRAVTPGLPPLATVCGSCILQEYGLCYVVVPRGPLMVHKALERGSYPQVSLSNIRHLMMKKHTRLGAWGDPASVPFSISDAITRQCLGWTGYTHAWPTCDPDFKNVCMASVQSVEDKERANEMRWRTFRVRAPWESEMDDEIICPASAEAGHKTQCIFCRICMGDHGEFQYEGGTRRLKNVTIISHGIHWKRFNALKKEGKL